MKVYNIGSIVSLAVIILMSACTQNSQKDTVEEFAKGTFGYDAQFLTEHQETIILSKGNARLAICPAYQGRVMTSSSSGDDGLSYGWLNYELIKSGEILKQINPVGGEDRFWLGPEGGQFSIFFDKGEEFVFEDWQTPPSLDSEPFKLVAKDESSVRFERSLQLTNYSGYTFNVKVDREISFLDQLKLDDLIKVPDGMEAVAYQSVNTITNTGQTSWNKETGALSIWILGMFIPSDKTTIVVPYKTGDDSELGPVVNDEYFGKVPAERLKVQDGIIFFSGDGKYRSKIGLNPQRALPYLGSYDGINNVLTLVYYTKPEGVGDYVNSMWELQEQPFAGDAVNSYNDGPVDGKAMGPFYELETSSPAAFLTPEQSITHVHSTIHIKGEAADLDALVQSVFGISLDRVKSAF